MSNDSIIGEIIEAASHLPIVGLFFKAILAIGNLTPDRHNSSYSIPNFWIAIDIILVLVASSLTAFTVITGEITIFSAQLRQTGWVLFFFCAGILLLTALLSQNRFLTHGSIIAALSIILAIGSFRFFSGSNSLVKDIILACSLGAGFLFPIIVAQSKPSSDEITIYRETIKVAFWTLVIALTGVASYFTFLIYDRGWIYAIPLGVVVVLAIILTYFTHDECRSLLGEKSASVFLFSGPDGGKSTFANALRVHINEEGKGHTNYSLGRDEFEETVISKMDSGIYPASTEVGYICNIFLKYGSEPTREIEIMDTGGQNVDHITGGIGVDESEVEHDIDTIVNNTSTSNTEPTVEEWDSLWKGKLIESDWLIFLVNIRQEMDGRLQDTTITTDTFSSPIVEEKQKKAIVFTGCDQLEEWKSDGHEPESLFPDFWDKNKIVDEHLVEAIRDKFGGNHKMTNMCNFAENRDDFDIFGVAVPSEENPEREGVTQQNPEREGVTQQLKKEDGEFCKQGFETVIKWIRK